MLFYTPFFGQPPTIGHLNAEGSAIWTLDRGQLSDADVVVFHVPSYSPRRWPRKYPGQIWVGWSQEANSHYPRQADADFMRRFDVTMTFEQSADVWTPYLPSPQAWEAIHATPAATRREGASVAIFASAGVDRSGRLPLLAELMRSVRIDSYGKLFNNRSLPGPDRGNATKIETLRRYPFAIAFENAIEPDYVTEKIFDALLAGAIPVYLGAPNVAEFVPEGCYIDAATFGGGRALGAHLNSLIEDPERAASYHLWRGRPLAGALLARAGSASGEPFLRLLELCRLRRGGAAPRRLAGPVARMAGDLVGTLRGWAHGV